MSAGWGLEPFTFIQRLFDPSLVESLRATPSRLVCAVSGEKFPIMSRSVEQLPRVGIRGVVPGESIGHGFKSRPPYS
jgi:hypothetical protein